jgi:hypothetical protein
MITENRSMTVAALLVLCFVSCLVSCKHTYSRTRSRILPSRDSNGAVL